MTHDLRFAVRQLVKRPGFVAVVVLSLALGIGANTTVFCWMQNMLLRPIPGVTRPEQLVVVTTIHGSVSYDGASRPNITDLAGLTNIVSGVIGSQVTPACLTFNDRKQWIYGQIVTANFFDVLGVRPQLGRGFLAEEDLKPGGNPVLVLSHGFWQRQFAGDTQIIGRTVDLNRHSFTIVGVAPAGFLGTMSGLSCDFWAPLTMHKEVANFGSLLSRNDQWLHTQARLQPGVSRERAQAALNVLAPQLEQAYPDTNKEIGFRLLPLWKSPYGGQAFFLPMLRILGAVSLGVLLIVMANVANLLLAQATSREKEIAVRLAMGAGRFRLIRQLLTESVLLALLGGIAGVLFYSWGRDLLRQFLPTTHLPIAYNFNLDARTLCFTLGLTLITGLLFGLAPALQAARADLNSTLKEGGRSSGAGSTHHRLRSALVVVEVALALLLLVGAGLCIKGFQQARKVDTGFDPHQVMLAGLRIGMNGYDEPAAKVFYRNLRTRLVGLPGVKEAALASWFPLGFEGGPSLGVDVEGYTRAPNEDVSIPYTIVTPRYFATLRIPLVAGRDFTDADDEKAPLAAVINETMAKRFWPGQNPLGRKFKTWRGVTTVIGIAKNGKYRSLNEPPRPFMYLACQQGVWDLNMGVCLRTEGNPAAMAGALRREIQALDSGVEVWAQLTMDDYIQAAFLAQKITAILLIALGSVALVLAAMGIYAVMAYVVSQRTREIGVRMALGAQSTDIMKLVLGHGLGLVLAGVGVGLAGALAATHLLASFLYGVNPFDLVTFGGVTLLLSLVALVACYVPTQKAMKVDPMITLRYE
jgi:predicted permease